MIRDTWIIGMGPMAAAYSDVLLDMQCPHLIVGRSRVSKAHFSETPLRKIISGGIEGAIMETTAPSKAIVAVSVESLASVTEKLLVNGIREILLEKPGGLTQAEINHLAALAKEKEANVMIGYNRRFFASVNAARRLIEEDGGLVSVYFEFSEWSHAIEKLEKATGVKERWVLGNSSHVIDLAFHLCGLPKHWSAFKQGSLNWHPTASRFSGAGITQNNILFSYFADWEGPGRWGIELITKKRRLFLRPMEQLSVVEKGSLNQISLDFPDADIDRKFKPGLYQQVETFLSRNYKKFCSIHEQTELAKVCYKIAGYPQSE